MYELDMRGIEDDILKEIKTIMWDYIWDSKPALIKKK
jgi:hypothetical protein